MFLRLKKVKGYHYAYLVENVRKRGKVSQKVKGYLGKALIPAKTKDDSFEQFVSSAPAAYLQQAPYAQVVQDLIKWELHKHDLGQVVFNADTLAFAQGKDSVVIKLNEGFLCAETVQPLLAFRVVDDDHYSNGQLLAESFVKAGIAVPQELFVQVFNKLMKEHTTSQTYAHAAGMMK